MLNKVRPPPVTHSKAKQQLAMLNRVSKPSKEPPSAQAPTQPSFLAQLLPPLLLEPLLATPMPERPLAMLERPLAMLEPPLAMLEPPLAMLEPPLAMLEPQSKARVPLQATPTPLLRILRRRIRSRINMHDGMVYAGVKGWKWNYDLNSG
jgi:hypothetical protein